MSPRTASATATKKAPVYTVTKTSDGYTLTLTDSFRADVLKAATDVDSLFLKVKPIAANLWSAYKKTVVQDATIGRLTFFRAFDQTIPSTYGRVGSAERKALDSHPVYNRLVYLTFKIGKIAAGDGPKRRDPKVAKKEAAAAVTYFGTWAKKNKISAAALRTLVLNILGFQSKDGDLTKRGRDYLKAAGVAVAEE